MRFRPWVLMGLCVGLCAGLASGSASAATVRLVIEPGAPGALRADSGACERVDVARRCGAGASVRAVTGVLVADRVGGRMVGVRGVLALEGGGQLVVDHGTIAMGTARPGEVAAQLVTRGHGVFTFLDRRLPGDAPGAHGLELRGGNDALGGERLGLHLVAQLLAAPETKARGNVSAAREPGRAGLLLAALVVALPGLTRRARRA